jgi:2-methylcitrate dehydratase PrpD
MLTDGSITFASSHDPSRMEDPTVKAVRSRVRLVANEELAGVKPPRQAIVKLAMRDGRSLDRRVVAVRGTADNPMSRQEVADKATELMGPVLGQGRCRRLIDRILAVEQIADLTVLRLLLVS